MCKDYKKKIFSKKIFSNATLPLSKGLERAGCFTTCKDYEKVILSDTTLALFNGLKRTGCFVMRQDYNKVIFIVKLNLSYTCDLGNLFVSLTFYREVATFFAGFPSYVVSMSKKEAASKKKLDFCQRLRTLIFIM